MTPDKIYIYPPFDHPNSLTEKTNENEIEYIHKDALLEWAKEKYEEYRQKEEHDGYHMYYGQRDAFQQVIEKLSSI